MQTFPSLRGRVSILRKRTNILVVNDSISKSNEPSKFIVGGKKNRRTKFEERENAWKGNLNREEWVFHHLPPSLAKRKLERSEEMKGSTRRRPRCLTAQERARCLGRNKWVVMNAKSTIPVPRKESKVSKQVL